MNGLPTFFVESDPIFPNLSQFQITFTVLRFFFYTCPPDSQQPSTNYPNLHLEMPKYCCPVEIFYFIYNFYLEIIFRLPVYYDLRPDTTVNLPDPKHGLFLKPYA